VTTKRESLSNEGLTEVEGTRELVCWLEKSDGGACEGKTGVTGMRELVRWLERSDG